MEEKSGGSYREYRPLEKELKEADKDEAERTKEISFLEFEIDEIENAGITAAECQSVEEDYRRMMQGKMNRRESGRGVSVYSRRRRYKCGRSDRTGSTCGGCGGRT